jgi:hypothetical protein
MMKQVRILISSGLVVLYLLSGSLTPRLARAQETVTSEPPALPVSYSVPEPCPKGKRGGAIGGIVVGSVFWWVLPMSIPVLITQTKKLKAHNAAKYERRCQYAPRP